MNKIEREEKIQFIRDSMLQIEDCEAAPDEFNDWTDEQVNAEYLWFEYLWTK